MSLTSAQIRQIIESLDLTLLSDTCSASDIDALCTKAQTPMGKVAAICIPPAFVGQASAALAGTGIKIATVAAFPHGLGDPSELEQLCARAKADGADEIDVVIPYEDILKGTSSSTRARVALVRKAASGLTIKAILETAALRDCGLIRVASTAALDGGAHFLKTSTGKHAAGGADLSAVDIMLRAMLRAAGGIARVKPSGGISTPEQALAYQHLYKSRTGMVADADHFRIGASSLLDRLLGDTEQAIVGAY